MTTLDFDRLTPAERQIVEAHTQEIPVKLGPLATDLGLNVRVGTLPPGISGEIRPMEGDPDRFIIRVNRHEKKERQRFTLAHEIAHYLLHRGLISSGLTDDIMYRSKLSDRYEVEANRAAAELLMPAAVIRRRVRENGGIVDEELAKRLANEFEVSLPAMKIRIGLK